jgi:hypothetical protein
MKTKGQQTAGLLRSLPRLAEDKLRMRKRPADIEKEFIATGIDPTEARSAINWLAAAGVERVTQRDVHRKFQAILEEASDVAAVLRILEKHGFLRRLPPAPRPRGGWSSSAFEVNPAVAG